MLVLFWEFLACWLEFAFDSFCVDVWGCCCVLGCLRDRVCGWLQLVCCCFWRSFGILQIPVFVLFLVVVVIFVRFCLVVVLHAVIRYGVIGLFC